MAVISHRADGDLSVSRDNIIGGNSIIHGRSHIRHNLQVDGWLDARHIKGPLKGLYLTSDDLIAAWPQPCDGWFALVGDSLPAQLWTVKDSQWVFTGNYSSGFDLDLAYYDDRILDLDRRLIRSILFSSTPRDGLLTALRTQENFLTPLPPVSLDSAGLMTALDLARLNDLEARLLSLLQSLGPGSALNTLVLIADPVPSALSPGQSFPLRVRAYRAGNDVSDTVELWTLSRQSSDPAADTLWDPPPYSSGGPLAVTLSYTDLLPGANTFTIHALTSDSLTALTAVLVSTGAPLIVDRGAWISGADYYAGDRPRPATGIWETSDTHRYSCCWRCRVTHTADDSNGPGYGSPMWDYVSGPRQLRIDTGAEEIILWPRETKEITCRVLCGQEDITHLVTGWGVCRTSSDTAADTMWDIDHNDFSGTLLLSSSDVITDRVSITVWADIKSTGQATQPQRLRQKIY